MRKHFFVLIFILGFLVTGVTHAAIVKYVVEGQLNQSIDRDYYYKTDLYNLNGAYYTREMIVNTSVSPNFFYSGETTSWVNAPGFLVSNEYYITGRPNGAPDLTIDGSVVGYTMDVQSTLSNGIPNDFVSLGSSMLSGALNSLFASDEYIWFKGDFISGQGYVTAPPYPFDASAIMGISANVWSYTQGGTTATIDGKYLQYQQTLFSAYASPVPLPSASLLFVSGFISVIGLVRRKKGYL